MLYKIGTNANGILSWQVFSAYIGALISWQVFSACIEALNGEL